MTRILVVDDDPQILRALRINLTVRGYEVDAVLDGTTALRAASAHHPDLVVLDLGLPDLDGVKPFGIDELLARIRAVTRRATPANSSDAAICCSRWGPQYETRPQYLRQYMAQLRRKLEDDPTRPHHLLTESGMGYRYRT